MPHQCVKCKSVFEDGSSTLLSGCSCGSKFFFFFKEADLKEKVKNLTDVQIIEMEDDIRDIIGSEDKDVPVILDLESIRVSEPGKFELDLVNLFARKPVIYKMEEGKYIIDLASTFQMINPNMKEKARNIKIRSKKKK